MPPPRRLFVDWGWIGAPPAARRPPPAVPAFAEDAAPVEVHAQVRPRLEFSTGKDGAAGAETLLVSQGTRLVVGATFPTVSLRVTFQDVRVWGSEANTLLDFTGDTIDLHEGWALWTPSAHVGVKVGRQEIVVEEQRLVGAVDWTQQGRAFDAAVVRADGGLFSVDAGAAVLADTDAPVAVTNAWMGFVRAGVAPTKTSTMDVVAFTVGGAVDGQGLHDGALKLGIKPVAGLGVNLDGHVFAAAAPAGEDAVIGEEADLWLNGRLGQRLSVAGGASAFLWAADKQPDAWVWLQTTVEL